LLCFHFTLAIGALFLLILFLSFAFTIFYMLLHIILLLYVFHYIQLEWHCVA